mmetsp:Transcript_21707/g.39904  ORF Transcript_21707/g.39904 Transcript_21707/m.39904 type:complete len:262 (+) Transcript_21707:2631-3416(+)
MLLLLLLLLLWRLSLVQRCTANVRRPLLFLSKSAESSLRSRIDIGRRHRCRGISDIRTAQLSFAPWRNGCHCRIRCPSILRGWLCRNGRRVRGRGWFGRNGWIVRWIGCHCRIGRTIIGCAVYPQFRGDQTGRRGHGRIKGGHVRIRGMGCYCRTGRSLGSKGSYHRWHWIQIFVLVHDMLKFMHVSPRGIFRGRGEEDIDGGACLLNILRAEPTGMHELHLILLRWKGRIITVGQSHDGIETIPLSRTILRHTQILQMGL